MEILIHASWYIGLMVSLIPYAIERQKTANMQSLVLRALFWQFSLEYQKKRCSWSFSLPWIKQTQRSRLLRTIVISAWTTLGQACVKKVISLWK
jgi:hypothetical protein